jgi:hypothetical protein
MDGRDAGRRTSPLWSIAVLLPVLCCALLPVLVAAGASAGIALLAVGVTLGAMVLGVALLGFVFVLRRRRAPTGRLPVERR